MPTPSPSQIQLIKASVPVMKEHGNDITISFYETLLQEHKELNNVFNQANQANNHQAIALASVLAAYATHITDLGVLAPEVEKICHKHASLYIRAEQYDVVGEYLLRAMQDVLGDALSKEMLDAWEVAYWQIANMMIEREKELLEEADGWTDWRDMRIQEKIKESEEITSFVLVPVRKGQNGHKEQDGVDGGISHQAWKHDEELPTFKPGQYISVMTRVPELKYLQSRQYSLSNAPGKDSYRISVKKEHGLDTAHKEAKNHPGYISNVLHENKEVGDIVQASHPEGTFFLDPDNQSQGPVVLMSAGVGLTPMVSILNTLVQRQSNRRISWLHATRSSEVQAFGAHIHDVTSKYENVHAVIFNKKPATGSVKGEHYHHVDRMRLDLLHQQADLFINDRTAEYYICGPGGFMQDMAAGLGSRGVDEERIHLELFGTGSIPK